MRASGQPVVINGPCLSACTMYLSLPKGQVCVTKRATFGFHRASTPLSNKVVWESYPEAVREWINKRGGLTAEIKHMQPAEAQEIVDRCPESAAADRS